MAKGNVGFITRPDGTPATVPYLASLGLTRFSVRPQTCNACHNPNFTLRVQDSTPVLPAGFAARRVGAGALCMACHNTRNGRIQWDASDPRRFTAPHVSAQGDVLMGKNAFFVNGTTESTISPHAAFTGDACVTCHMRLSDESHTFKASTAVCKNCHGTNFRAEFVQRSLSMLLDDLGRAIDARVLAQKGRIATVGAWDPKTDRTAANTPVDPATILSAEPTEFHGQMGIKFGLSGGRELYTLFADMKDATGALVFPTSDLVVRAGWSYFLFHSDGSKGVHNPRFYRVVILATIDALK